MSLWRSETGILPIGGMILTTAQLPLALLHLEFDTREAHDRYFRSIDPIGREIWLWHETLGNQNGSFTLPGICEICAKCTAFDFNTHPSERIDTPFPYRVNWRMSGRCSGCGLIQIDRSIISLLRNEAVQRPYVVGFYSALAQWLLKNIPNTITSQFFEGKKPGELLDNGIRHEDLTCLSFDDAELDCIIHSEVLEHIPNYKAALREMTRTLKPGGKAIMTFPFANLSDQTIVRAIMEPCGTIKHLMPPEYHGDPAGPDGILCYQVFGWDILDHMREAGFSKATVHRLFGPTHGYMAPDFVFVGTK